MERNFLARNFRRFACTFPRMLILSWLEFLNFSNPKMKFLVECEAQINSRYVLLKTLSAANATRLHLNRVAMTLRLRASFENVTKDSALPVLVYIFGNFKRRMDSIFHSLWERKEQPRKRYLNLRRFLKGIAVLFDFHQNLVVVELWEFYYVRILQNVKISVPFKPVLKVPELLAEWNVLSYLIYYSKGDLNRAVHAQALA